MSEETDLHRKELQEMARVILCEIYGAEKKQNSLVGADYSDAAGKTGLRLDFAESGFEGLSAIYKSPAYQSPRVSFAQDGNFYPRFGRREFLNQRSERRGIKTAYLGKEGQPATSAAAEFEGASRHENYIQTDLPEKLSDIFCRDARRYDGAYERF